MQKGGGDSIWEHLISQCPKGTPLVCACEKGHLEDVRMLVEGHDAEKTGMSVDEMVSKEGESEDSCGESRTPLQSAAAKEQFEIVKYLVKSCTTVDLIGQTNSNGFNSLHYAAWKSKKDVQLLQFLIENYNGDIKDIINCFFPILSNICIYVSLGSVKFFGSTLHLLVYI